MLCATCGEIALQAAFRESINSEPESLSSGTPGTEEEMRCTAIANE